MPIMSKHGESNLVLALEASGETVSVALTKRDGPATFKQHNAPFGHAEHLVGMVEAVMHEAGASFSDLTHIAAGCGPGSFTGLRVCLSAAKGYLLATSATALGVNGLAALALATISEGETDQKQQGPLVCFADTRRKSLFVQEFDQQAKVLFPVRDLPLEQISNYIEEICLRFDGQYLTLAGHVAGLCDLLPPDKHITCRQRPVDAQMIAHYALQSLSLPQLYPCSGLEPIYVVAPKLGPAKRQV